MNPNQRNQWLKQVHQKLQTNFPYFAKNCEMIPEKKGGGLIPFVFNSAQEKLHREAEEQLLRTGKIRKIIVKGRQQGCSTYVAGRFYWIVTRNKGKFCFILSHESSTTEKLYGMVNRFHDNIHPSMRPTTAIHNRRQMQFTGLGSEYALGTAGNEMIGRGGTLQLFHGSEVAFWEKTDGIETGVMQSVADVAGTEIFLESTANGFGNMFHRMVIAALDPVGDSDYEVVFIAWFMQKEYRAEVPVDFLLTNDEVKLKEQFKLDDEQVVWRRRKIANFGSVWKFRQEYPNTIQDAFVTSGDSLIDPDYTLAARKSIIKDPSAPLILGVDPARTGDRCVIARRRGREITRIQFIKPDTDGKIRETQVAAKLASIIDNEDVAKCFVDVAHGYGVIDILKDLGYGDIVKGIHFNGKTSEPHLYSNIRAEMHLKLRDWIHSEEVSIPDKEDIQMDFCVIPDYEETMNGLIKIVDKKKIKKIYGRSPDITDACMLTFAFPVRRKGLQSRRNQGRKIKRVGKNQSPLTTMNRVRNRDRGRQQGTVYRVSYNT